MPKIRVKQKIIQNQDFGINHSLIYPLLGVKCRFGDGGMETINKQFKKENLWGYRYFDEYSLFRCENKEVVFLMIEKINQKQRQIRFAINTKKNFLLIKAVIHAAPNIFNSRSEFIEWLLLSYFLLFYENMGMEAQ